MKGERTGTPAQEIGELRDRLQFSQETIDGLQHALANLTPPPAEIGAELSSAWNVLVLQVAQRLRLKARHVGREIPSSGLLSTLDEIQEEMADICGWTAILLVKLNRVRDAIERFDVKEG